VYSGVVQMPGYQPAMVPAPMPMMPAMGTVPAIPGKLGQGYQGPFSGGQPLALGLEEGGSSQESRGAGIQQH
jgi:hypothetical protein